MQRRSASSRRPRSTPAWRKSPCRPAWPDGHESKALCERAANLRRHKRGNEMAIEITGYTPAHLSRAKGDTPQVGRQEQSTATQQTGKSQTTVTVTMTDTTSQLRKLETMISALPVVDIARVDNVRQAIKTGRLEFNPDRVAD